MKIHKKIIMLLLAACILLQPSVTYASSTPMGQTPSGLPFSDLESTIEMLVAENMAEFTPGTAITIVHEGEVIFSRGFGYADLAQEILATADSTVFEYGSINKLFIYVSAMQLVEQGVLDLDADIHDVLPTEFANALNFRYTFTVRDLMNHSAGFGENIFYLFQDAEADFRRVSLQDTLIRACLHQVQNKLK